MTVQSAYSFNLIDQPCIPAIDVQGSPQTASLCDVLVKAHTLREVHQGSPVVTASLVRLLVALITDIYPIVRPSQWAAIWNRKSFDPVVIEAYLNKYHDRFNLFHDRFPFYQCAALEDDNPINLNLLACELSSGNNPLLFDHSLDTEERDYSPTEAFHLLLATQSFALAGLLRRTTRLKGEIEPIYWQSAYGGPMIPGAMIWLTGDNLFETLCLNLAPVAPVASEDKDDLGESDADLPIWRVDAPEALRDTVERKTLMKISARGTRDRLTFQSRLVRLLPAGNVAAPVVRRAAFNHGRSLPPSGQGAFDPMLAYRASKKEGYLVTRLSSERAAWRDSHSLIGLNQRTGGKLERVTPRALHQLHESLALSLPGLDSSRTLRLNIAGLANDQAKILLWRHDRLDAPAKALCDAELATRVGTLLQEAEEMAGSLRAASRRLCELFIAPFSVDARGKPAEGALRADPDRVTALANAVDTRPTYWARLESAFHQLLLNLAEDADTASEHWRDKVQEEARAAFADVVARLGDGPRTGKAEALVNPYFVVTSRQVSAPGRTLR